MSIAAALALQSIPFAGLVMATGSGHRDVFPLLYAAALGLTLSAIALIEGQIPMSFGPPETHR
ncbi:hypothetical protein M446_3284 [Methylobacterium sp. 4-46]|uniref:hypothetical protein n=1 Tax=unclassified Methylobacterium TaxID=2615210 RepID=UPI000165C5FA|nr:MULTISPECIES: hypothetical protein [Methylobacterium]ACA17689.1 hypothetical protein M446_3284 [Methylobacterium sp. 4-46]WFT83359.1 hypothetical protein QA634_16650 [Methylobacterium nodulans]